MPCDNVFSGDLLRHKIPVLLRKETLYFGNFSGGGGGGGGGGRTPFLPSGSAHDRLKLIFSDTLLSRGLTLYIILKMRLILKLRTIHINFLNVKLRLNTHVNKENQEIRSILS